MGWRILGDALVLALALAEVAGPMSTFIGVVVGFAPVQLPLVVLEAVASTSDRLPRGEQTLPPSLRTLIQSKLPTASVMFVLIAVSLSVRRTVCATAEAAGRAPQDSSWI